MLWLRLNRLGSLRAQALMGVLVFAPLIATAQSLANEDVLANQPEIASTRSVKTANGKPSKPDVIAQRFAVASANPLATQAGFDVLDAGGSAMDAAIAVQLVLGLVEPQSSGIGGGALILHSHDQHVVALDGRETAPALVQEDLFLDAQGKPLAFYDAVVGGRSVGTPGTLRVLALAHQRFGKLPWARLFEPAIGLARQGFAISPRLFAQLKADPFLRQDPQALAYFYESNGEPHSIGFVLKNPAYAQVLQRVAKEGVDAFYSGAIAQAVVDKVQRHPSNPGQLQLSDLRNYQAKTREAMCFEYAAAQRMLRVCGFPPPSSGLIAMGQILGMLSYVPNSQTTWVNGLPSAAWLHSYFEASRLAFADRAQYVGDPDFVPAPAGNWASLLQPEYLQQRAQRIGKQRMNTAPAGTPQGASNLSFSPSPEQQEHGTSHISVVDAQGNAVAMTTTVESSFGSRQMVQGFMLNNELTDFSFVPRDAAGKPVANRVQPNKRPRSSMSPTLVFDKATGELLMSLGSPGGALIIPFTTKTFYGVWQWGLTPQQAIDLPNFVSIGGALWLEANAFPADTLNALRQAGHELSEQELTSGLQAIVRTQINGQSVWMGGADSRREGVVMGR